MLLFPVLCMMERSGAWPKDREAVRKLKGRFYVEMAEHLEKAGYTCHASLDGLSIYKPKVSAIMLSAPIVIYWCRKQLELKFKTFQGNVHFPSGDRIHARDSREQRVLRGGRRGDGQGFERI